MINAKKHWKISKNNKFKNWTLGKQNKNLKINNKNQKCSEFINIKPGKNFAWKKWNISQYKYLTVNIGSQKDLLG